MKVLYIYKYMHLEIYFKGKNYYTFETFFNSFSYVLII